MASRLSSDLAAATRRNYPRNGHDRSSSRSVDEGKREAVEDLSIILCCRFHPLSARLDSPFQFPCAGQAFRGGLAQNSSPCCGKCLLRLLKTGRASLRPCRHRHRYRDMPLPDFLGGPYPADHMPVVPKGVVVLNTCPRGAGIEHDCFSHVGTVQARGRWKTQPHNQHGPAQSEFILRSTDAGNLTQSATQRR